MHRNMGVTEKAMRIAAGAVLLGLTSVELVGPWGYLGLLPLATGLARWCPLYAAMGAQDVRSRPSAVTTRSHS